ncbi:hypothetical protein PssvBMR16_gp18 [Pseudomonas phage MR16]|nr:hypothetical protein PssvBMR16_gp18 [Pseudomonas phage MR16]
MPIPPSEYLQHAKSLAVGQTGRFYHKCGPGKVLHVGNSGARYWCKCYRCHQGGVTEKTHATLARIPDQKRFMPWADDAKDLNQWPGYTQELLLNRTLRLQHQHVHYPATHHSTAVYRDNRRCPATQPAGNHHRRPFQPHRTYRHRL